MKDKKSNRDKDRNSGEMLGSCDLLKQCAESGVSEEDVEEMSQSEGYHGVLEVGSARECWQGWLKKYQFKKSYGFAGTADGMESLGRDPFENATSA